MSFETVKKTPSHSSLAKMLDECDAVQRRRWSELSTIRSSELLAIARLSVNQLIAETYNY